MKAYILCCIVVCPSRASRNFSATAAPAAYACPCPNGPEEFSMPWAKSRSGCPGVTEPH